MRDFVPVRKFLGKKCRERIRYANAFPLARVARLTVLEGMSDELNATHSVKSFNSHKQIADCLINFGTAHA